MERAMVCFGWRSRRQWDVIGILFDDGESEGAGARGVSAAPSYSGVG